MESESIPQSGISATKSKVSRHIYTDECEYDAMLML